MQSKATTVSEYLAELPADRRKAMTQLRKVIKANLGKGFAEGMQYGMIGYFVPHKVFPPGYHCNPEQPLPFASIASQKNHLAFYSFFLYQNKKELERFQKAWKAKGHKLDMGKSCVRFKSIDDVPLEVIGDAFARQDCKEYVAAYLDVLGPNGRPVSTRKKAASKKTPAKKKAVAKKPAAKKAAGKKTIAKKNRHKKDGEQKENHRQKGRKEEGHKGSGPQNGRQEKGHQKEAPQAHLCQPRTQGPRAKEVLGTLNILAIAGGKQLVGKSRLNRGKYSALGAVFGS